MKAELEKAKKEGEERAYRKVAIKLHREGMNVPFIAAIVEKQMPEVKEILQAAGIEEVQGRVAPLPY